MMKVIITDQLPTWCEDNTKCHCPKITGNKACVLVMLANEFVSDTNPVSFEMSEKDFSDFRFYLAIASLKERK